MAGVTGALQWRRQPRRRRIFAGTGSAGAAAVVVSRTGAALARRPREVKRKTISTPLRPSVAGSFAAACCRRKSIASRMLASRNSIRGMMIVLSLLRDARRAGGIFWQGFVQRPDVCPYWRTGSSQPFCTCQSGASAFRYRLPRHNGIWSLSIRSCPRRAATL